MVIGCGEDYLKYVLNVNFFKNIFFARLFCDKESIKKLFDEIWKGLVPYCPIRHGISQYSKPSHTVIIREIDPHM